MKPWHGMNTTRHGYAGPAHPLLAPGFTLPVSELPELTPGHARTRPMQGLLDWRLRARHMPWRWLGLFLPATWLAAALVHAAPDAMPAWVWISMALFGFGFTLEMYP